jgi:hypothetical protein
MDKTIEYKDLEIQLILKKKESAINFCYKGANLFEFYGNRFKTLKEIECFVFAFLEKEENYNYVKDVLLNVIEDKRLKEEGEGTFGIL